MLAAGALVASLLAVGAGPAAALDEDSKPDKPAATSACVGDANDDMMFSDVSEGHAFRGDINCLAYYGVTVGYGDGTFGPNADVSNEEMVLFMERAAGVAGADAEAVVGDFAETGSDPVNRGDMALLIARLLVSATSAESPVNVKTNDDGTFTVDGVAAKDWDYFADSRRSQNRVSDSAASALYELGVAKGTGMGYFSPASTVSRGAMAAFITRALAHTTARPAGVTIQTDGPGEVIISVRDANFQPAANATVDVFSVSDTRIDEAFKADGSCNIPRLRGEGDVTPCEIGHTDAVTGLSGDHDPGRIEDVQPGGRTVFAWTGEAGDKVEDGAEGLASVSLTETPPVTAAGTKITHDLGENVTRAAFGSTVTVTIQLVGAAPDRKDAISPTDGVTYQVVTRSTPMRNQATDDPKAELAEITTGAIVTTKPVTVDASGKATFEITAADPDPNNDDDPDSGSIDWVTVTYVVTTTATVPNTEDPLPYVNAEGADAADANTDTIRFSDASSVVHRASVTPTAKYLEAPSSGSTGNVVTVKVVDQYGKPVRGHQVELTGAEGRSAFPRPRQTDSSGTVRIGYSFAAGAGLIETLTARTPAAGDTDAKNIDGGTAMFYWVSTPAPPTAPATGVTVTAAILRVADVDSNTVVIGAEGAAPQLLVYDDNDQFAIGENNSTMEAFEEQLAKKDPGNNDTVGVTQYNPTDSTVVARFTLTVVPDS